MADARIFIVEDERIVARDLENRLTSLGYQVVGHTAFGEQVVPMVCDLRPDLVLMDIRLKGQVDGIGATEELLKRVSIPVVYLTAHADEATLKRARVTEPFGYILKPFEERELHTVIEIALYKHQADVSRKLLEEQLHQAQKMEAIGQLAAGIAHDFNNLLTVINGYANLLSEAMPSDSPWSDPVRAIAQAGDRAADLTRQLLAFSRKQIVQPRILNLGRVVSGSERLLRRLIPENIELLVESDPEIAPIKVDLTQIEQVILNLATNARDAMPEGGELRVEARQFVLDEAQAALHPGCRCGRYACLVVRDTGMGMDSITRGRIFEPFFTTKEVGKGTGLGLATVYGIVKSNGGHIEVVSEVGKGTTFFVYLPCVEGEEVPLLAEPLRTELGGRETLLLVEDEEGVRLLSAKVLRQAGYLVLEARNGIEALEITARSSERVQLLISDLIMPQMSGQMLALLLRRDRPDLGVLFVSGYSDLDLSSELAFEARFLHKPFTPTTLLAKVREVLDRKDVSEGESIGEWIP